MTIIDNIDRALGCHWCEGPLDGSVSDLFCSQDCQEDWHAARTEPLLDYREPDDLPQHVWNLVEDEAPETTPHASQPSLGRGVNFDRVYLDEVVRIRQQPVNTGVTWFVTTPAASSSVREMFERFRRAVADGGPVYHASVDQDGHVAWYLEPWQQHIAEQLLELRRVNGGTLLPLPRLSLHVPRRWDHPRLSDSLHAALLALEVREAHQRAIERERQAVVDVEPSAQARALELRQQRNTGPTPRRRRPPRHLGPRT